MGVRKSHKLVDIFTGALIVVGTLGFIGGFVRAGYAPFIGIEEGEATAEHFRQLHALLAAVLGLLLIITATLLRIGARLITYHDSLDLLEMVRMARGQPQGEKTGGSPASPMARFRVTGLDAHTHQRTQIVVEAHDMDEAREAGARKGLQVVGVDALHEGDA